MTVPASIETDVDARQVQVLSMIDNALLTTNQYLGTIGFFFDPLYATAGQTEGTPGAAPEINADKPSKPRLPSSAVSPAVKYVSAFVMPEAGEITDDSVAKNTFDHDEKTYTEWMLPEIKEKILAGFNDFAMTVAVESGIWSRHDQRLIVARIDAGTRRRTRWTGRGFSVSPDDLNARAEEVNANFSYADADNARNKLIKTAELKDDNRKASIMAALKGEQIYVQHYEGIAQRALEAAEATLKFGVEAFKANAGKYKDVTLEQWMNDLIYFTEDLKVKIATSKADVSRYSTNTKLISTHNRTNALEFDADAEAVSADAFYNEAKADVNTDSNRLAIEELEFNIGLKLAEMRQNLAGFQKKVNINQGFTHGMGAAYAQYLTATLQSINVLMAAAKSDIKEITA